MIISDTQIEQVALSLLWFHGFGTDAPLESKLFTDPRHIKLAEILKDYPHGYAPLLLRKLKDTGQLAQVGGADYLALIMKASVGVDSRNAPRVIYDHLRAKWLQRELVARAAQVSRLAASDPIGALKLMDELRAEATATSGVEWSGLGDVLPSVLAELERGPDRRTVVATGITRLDSALTGGMRPGQLIMLAASPGMGKSALALHFSIHAARQAMPVLYISLEMGRNELGARLLSHELEFGNRRPDHTLNQEDRDKAHAQIASLSELPLIIYDSSSPTLEQVEALVARAVSELNARLIVVDYLQLLQMADTDNRALAVGQVSAGLKRIARQYQLPILALSQLNREIWRRTNHTPTLADLRDSGSLEADADIVLFLHDEAFYTDPDSRALAEQSRSLMIAKHRNGRTDNIALKFVGSQSQFSEVAPLEPVSPIALVEEEW